MRDLAYIHYPNAELIRVVLDNLSTHNPRAQYETFPAPEAHRILRRLSFITHPNTRAGSIRWKSKSACCVGNVWIAASANGSPSSPKSKPGSDNETLPAHAGAM